MKLDSLRNFSIKIHTWGRTALLVTSSSVRGSDYTDHLVSIKRLNIIVSEKMPLYQRYWNLKLKFCRQITHLETLPFSFRYSQYYTDLSKQLCLKMHLL